MQQLLCVQAALLGLVLQENSFRVVSSPTTRDAENLNGDYVLSQTPGGKDTQKLFPTHFRDYPRGVTSFDVYSPPVKTLYSQVFWKALDPVDLPEDIVKRFDGKGMAVVGFELDQVRQTPSGDVSVPLTVTYNHHFESTMIGKHATFEKVTHTAAEHDPHFKKHMDMGHGMPHGSVWLARELGTSGRDIPVQQVFGGANGGEVRKSFHGYAPGYVQIIDSPTQFQITPMQIDTWHRDKMNISYPTRFVPGPVPRSSLAPTTGPDALYSGLLECPVTTRIQKHIKGLYFFHVGKDACGMEPATADECFSAARATLNGPGYNFTYASGTDSGRPLGCSVASDGSKEPGLVHVYFHHNKSISNDGARRTTKLKTVGRQGTTDPKANSTVSCGVAAVRFAGHREALAKLSVLLDVEKQQAEIMMTGPGNVWFGIGFGATNMGDSPWAIIVDGHGVVTERKLGEHNPGTLLNASVTVKSSVMKDGLRSVVLTRGLQGLGPDYFTFDPMKNGGTEINFINAVGSSIELSYHKEHVVDALSLLPVADSGLGAAACVCKTAPKPFGEAMGTLEYVATKQPEDTGSGSQIFNNKCPPHPRGDLLAMKNPTCDIRTYSGGQIACHHMFSLLDADQEIPWPDQPLEYRLKFRFWVQEYNASYHVPLQRATWGIASPVEYDVPKCSEGMTGCSRHADGSWVHTITGTFNGSGRLSAAHFHCHAPTCLSIAMYRCPKGTKVCNASTGELLCKEEPIFGKDASKPFEDPGFILQPPCLWGSSEFGLEPPPSVDGYVLGSVKTANATYGHHGEMAWQQMYLFTDKDLPGNYNYV